MKRSSAFMRENFSSLIWRHVPRIVPSTPILVPRVENIIDTFKGVRDGVTGETLFKPPLTKVADNVLEHVKKGCVSDPDPRKVQLFHHSGRTKDGLDKVRLEPRADRNEGYHQRLLQLLGAFNISPLMTHYILLLHNYRRNHRMAVLHQGMPSELQGFYNHNDVEAIQAITREMYDDAPVYAGWESSASFLDTGEVGGLLTSCNPEQARKELEQLSGVSGAQGRRV